MIRRYEATDAASLWPAYEEVFGREAARSLQVRWDWQYMLNPFNPGEPEVYVLVHDEKVVGMHAAFAVPLIIQGAHHQGFFLTDFFALPDFRLGGIGLVKTMQKIPGIGMGMPNALSRKLWDILGCYQYYQSRKRTVLLNECAYNHRPITKNLIKPIAMINSRWVKAKSKRLFRPIGATIENRLIGCESALDDFWQNCESDVQISLRKNANYLKWRYIDIPERDYQFRLCLRANRVVALVVYEIRGTSGIMHETLCLRGKESFLKMAISRQVHRGLTGTSWTY